MWWQQHCPAERQQSLLAQARSFHHLRQAFGPSQQQLNLASKLDEKLPNGGAQGFDPNSCLKSGTYLIEELCLCSDHLVIIQSGSCADLIKAFNDQLRVKNLEESWAEGLRCAKTISSPPGIWSPPGLMVSSPSEIAMKPLAVKRF